MCRRFILLCLPLVLTLSACSTQQSWVIQLKDGRKLTSLREPEFQRKTGYYRYRNQNDRDALVQAQEVLLIERQR
jgi:hypothetical protein